MAAFLISLQLLPLVLFSPFLWAAVAFVAVVAGVAWRHRSRLLPTFLDAELSVWWAGATYVLANMAVTGNWL
jgi:hypothetical protein